jgi:O-antigen/teichoic acid export membrane protein
MSATARAEKSLWGDEDHTVVQVAHNVSTRYLAYLIDALIGLVMLPFNLAHLGMTAYGLWVVTSSITIYFSMLDLGYGGALVRFVAEYRAKRDREALNEVLSTLSVIYTGIAIVTYAMVMLLAFNLTSIVKVSPEQVTTSRLLLLIIGANVALRFIFGVYGGVIVGFQRYHLNNLTSIVTSIAVALVNVLVLLSGYGIVELVAATTAVRVLALLVYRINAHRVFPGLSIDWRRFRRARLREVTGFSVFMLLLDGAYKLNYSSDVLVIGAFVGAPAVALWSPAQRLTEVMLRLSNQLSEALFPIVVDCDASQSAQRLRMVFLQGTRLSLATVVPIAGGTALLAAPLLTAWLGRSFSAAATGTTTAITQILALVVILRVGSSTASVVLKGAGQHRLLTWLICGTAIANVALSIALIPAFGLTGVAIGTLVPVGAVSIFSLIPAACRRVGVSLIELTREALWPALWPAGIAAGLLVATRDRVPVSLVMVAVQLAIGAAIYFGLFLLAIGSDGRQEYLRHASILLKRAPSRVGSVGTANAS